jgi:hypothetical protein
MIRSRGRLEGSVDLSRQQLKITRYYLVQLRRFCECFSTVVRHIQEKTSNEN